MILFKAEHVPMILEGRKTQTRRLWPHGKRANVGALHWAQTGMKPDTRFARLRILRVWQEPLDNILDNPADAVAEGYDTPVAYLSAFQRINKLNSDQLVKALRQPVWCVEFEVAQ